LESRKQWAAGAFAQYGWSGANIPANLRAEEGRVLTRWGELGWGEMVRDGKLAGTFSDELVAAAAELVRDRWLGTGKIGWVTCVPSLRHPALVPDLARRLADALVVPYRPVVTKARETQPQKEMENRYYQCRNLDGAFIVDAAGVDIKAPVLLVDDVTDSGWTLAVIAALLRQAGSGPVFPFALASAAAD
jgi:ATP-dependent DNA helicase RecQ